MKYLAILLTALFLTACGTKPSLLEQTNQYAITLGDRCSGQFIDNEDDLIATASHCVDVTKEKDIPIFLRMFDENGIEVTKYQYTAEVVARDAKHDVLILKLTYGDYIFKPVKLNSNKVSYGDLVYTVGNPYMFYRTISQGHVVKAAYRDWFLVDAFMAPGISGGACLNSDGELIGLTNGGLGRIDSPWIGYIVRTEYIIALLESME